MNTPHDKSENAPDHADKSSEIERLNPANREARIRHVHHVLRQRATKGALGIESSDTAAESNSHPDDVLARFDNLINHMPPDELGDCAEFKKALSKLLKHGEPALRKLFLPPTQPQLSSDELVSLEALIIADGSRPSFLLREGEFVTDHPFLRNWKDDMTVFRPTLRKLAGCVGRIQPAGGGPTNYNGTGTLIDAENRLVLTNYHVVKHARNISGVAMDGAGDRLTVNGDWFIDFLGETGRLDRNLWRVKEVRLPIGAGVSFDGIDAAVLRIEALDGNEDELPEPAIVLSGLADYATGEASPTLVTIGFPGAPDTRPTDGVTVDWDFVVKTLFNNRFGVKRVAPGRFGLPAGSVPDDHIGHILSHDATTFGGASGSLLFAWRDEKTPAFALHFAGATLGANYAVSLAKAATALRSVGAPIANAEAAP